MNPAKLSLNSTILAYSDVEVNSNPSERFFDWFRSITVDVNDPQGNAYTIDPGASLDIFDGTRSTGIDNTTEFQLTISPLYSTTYRFTWTGTGTAPAFRTDRGLALNGDSFTLTVNVNLTATLSGSSGDFTSVLAGDVLFVPGLTTGDTAGPFSSDNEGYWNVLSKDGTSATLQLARFGDSFSGVTETVTLTANSQLQAFSATGVQVGDSVKISNGFSLSVQGSYTVNAINPKWFEIVTTKTLPINETAIPTASGINFYTSAKRYIRIEADQNCIIKTNGNTGNSEELQPWDSDLKAEYTKTGPTWSLSVDNKSTLPLNLLVMSCE